VTVDPALVATARASAERAAVRAQVTLRPLTELDELQACEVLFSGIWGRADGPPMAANLLRALTSAGSYLVGAYDGTELLGACVGFWGPPDQPLLHGHIAGVSVAARGRELGYALKLHQRADALRRGVTVVVWTYDPLIARNAHLNLRKLGGRPAKYVVNYYGPMPDAINADDDTDRILLRWELDSESARLACDAHPRPEPPADTSLPTTSLGVGPEGQPVRMTDPADRAENAQRYLVQIPQDFESLRRTNATLARAWRIAVREALGPLLDRGGRVVDFDRRAGYVIEEGPRP